uniref:Serpin family I member 2 n=1 Tax=Crocodylus porosus TaxID=8502 RepID=A0A7M4EP00_CROPO
MVQLGAKGKALFEMNTVLKLQGNEDGEYLKKKKKEFTFNLANALYLQEGFIVKEQDLHSNKEFFQTAIKLVNFQDTKASTEAISTWNFAHLFVFPIGKIKKKIVSTIYFKGHWKQKFRPEAMLEMVLTKRDGSVTKMPMMYFQLRTKIDILTYTCPSVSYQMRLLEVEKLMTVFFLSYSFYRFKIEQKMDFKESLHSLNVREIFSGGCNLSGKTEATQKVSIEVREDGSEAAVSTHKVYMFAQSHRMH